MSDFDELSFGRRPKPEPGSRAGNLDSPLSRGQACPCVGRRNFLKKSVLASAGAGLGLSLEEKILLGKRVAKAGKAESVTTGKELPMGGIGKLKISRLICGGNLINGFAHGRDLIYVSALPGHDNMWCVQPKKTIEFMNKVKKPWIAYKVLAAGAIHPEVGFPYAFENGADFICVGMYDFQIVEDVNLAVDVLSGDLERERPWRA